MPCRVRSEQGQVMYVGKSEYGGSGRVVIDWVRSCQC